MRNEGEPMEKSGSLTELLPVVSFRFIFLES